MRKRNNSKKITVIIPCYNEEGNIEILYQKLAATLINTKVEYIFIDDGSRDDTLIIIKNLARINRSIKFISFSRNFGHQNAIRAGLEFASGDCVITLDADLQHPPQLIPTLLKKWEEGYDIVYTIRKDQKKLSKFKKLSALYYYKIINYLADIELTYGSADFRLLDRKIVKILVNDISEYPLFYRGLIRWIGYKQIGVEYIANERFAGQTKYPLYKMINFAIEGITSFSLKPLRISIFIGFFFSLLSAFYAIYVIFLAIFTNKTILGWPSLITTILFMGGMNMILLGIIGEYIGKIFIQSKKRPFYLIKETNIKT